MARAKHKRLLLLRIEGPGIRSGAITVPDLIKICEQAQSAVNRQAEAMEGAQSLRPGPVISAVKRECTLELVGFRKGSVTLQFDLAKPQLPLPAVPEFGSRVVESVAAILDSMSRKSRKAANLSIDPGVLDSLNSLGEVFDRGTVSRIEWVVPRRNGRRRSLRAVYTKAVRERVAEKIRLPGRRKETVEGTLEMADFKEADQRCRIHPLLGRPIPCTFDKEKEDAVYAALRKTVRLTGEATINPNSGRVENIHVENIHLVEPLLMGAQVFLAGRSIQELAQMQGVKPLETVRVLAGGWPEQDNLDELLDEIYQDREL